MNQLKSIVIALLVLTAIGGCKELQPVLDQVKPLLGKQQGDASSTFTTEQMVTAIKQALSQGIGDSVDMLGRARGFSISDVYRIPIPHSLQKPADVLRQLGQGKRVDEFESRLNMAAEQAVAKAMPVFTDAVRDMSVSDAVNILQGADNSATQYFRDKTDARLRAQFMPIIQQATGESGLTSSYKTISDKIATYVPQYKSKLVDIDHYVLDNAMNALFDRIAIEEQQIRQNPAKRSTDLMKSVFAYFSEPQS